MMKKTIVAAGALTLPFALAIAGTTQAQDRAGQGAMADGVLTKAEYDARGAAMWQRLDVNGDGALDQADRQARAAERFGRIDADGSGELTQAEMQAAREARRAAREERRAMRQDRRFARLDSDASDGLSQAELTAARQARGERVAMRGGMKVRRGGRGGGAMLRMADADGDQRISQAEFQAVHARRFAALDADGDGQVTTAERRAQRQAARVERR